MSRVYSTMWCLGLAASLALTGCASTRTTSTDMGRERVGAEPGTTTEREVARGTEGVEERTRETADNLGRRTEEAYQGVRENLAMGAGGVASDIQRAQDAENSFRKAVTDVQVRAKEGNRSAYRSASQRAFDQMGTTLNDVARMGMTKARPGEQPVSERAVAPEVPAALRQKLDQLRNVRVNENEPATAVSQRWRMVADTMEQVARQMPSGAQSTQAQSAVQQIRSLAGQVNQSNQLTMEPRLFEQSERAINSLLQSTATQRIQQVTPVASGTSGTSGTSSQRSGSTTPAPAGQAQ